ncbi:hypothetical protein ACFV90_11315 [Streptomyces sp. NPDC059904]|uniref:hypothetical protein n=1 Tax=unclassified Streptomyces TaxID=2593676 RepID=UPI00363492A1
MSVLLGGGGLGAQAQPGAEDGGGELRGGVAVGGAQGVFQRGDAFRDERGDIRVVGGAFGCGEEEEAGGRAVVV